MAEMTPRDRVQSVFAGEIPDRVPYVEMGIDFPFICKLLALDMPAGRYFDSGEVESAPIHIQRRVNEVLHRDNLVFSMLPPIPAIKAVGHDGMRFFKDGKIKSWADLEQLNLPDPASEAMLTPARNFMAQAGDYATICACRVGISATYLAMGMEHFYYMLHDDPALVVEVLRRYTDYAAAVAEQAARLGFDIFWTADDIATGTGTLFSPAMLRELMLPHVRKVAERVHDVGMRWIYHSDGKLNAVMTDLLDLGIHGLNPIDPNCMDIRALKEQFGHLIVLSGNVDVHLLTSGTPEQVRVATQALLRDVAPGGRYMLASGNSVASYCDVECVKVMCDTLYEYGRYPISV